MTVSLMPMEPTCQKGLCGKAATRIATYYSDGKPVALQFSCDGCGAAPTLPLTAFIVREWIAAECAKAMKGAGR